MSEAAFAQHIISSIRNELNLLKTHNYLQPHAYDEILRLLPANVGNRNMPPPAMGGYPSPNPPSSFAGGMPVPSPTQSTTSIPATPATVISPPAYNAPNDNKLGTAEALYDYTGANLNTDLSFRRGDIIQLTELVNDDWWKGILNGKTGIFPRTYVKRNEPVINEKHNTPPPPPARQAQRDSYGYSNEKVPSSYNYPPPPQQQQAPSYAAPPQQSSYAPPPVQYQQQNYAPPPVQQVSTYGAPPPIQQQMSTSSAPAAVEQSHEESKLSGFGKKLAGNVANAATWGFGATLGSDVAHSIF